VLDNEQVVRDMLRDVMKRAVQKTYDLPRQLDAVLALEPKLSTISGKEHDAFFDKYIKGILAIPSCKMHSGFTGGLMECDTAPGPVPVMIVYKLARTQMKTSSRMFQNAIADAMDSYQTFKTTSTEGPAHASFMEIGVLLQHGIMEVFMLQLFEQSYRFPMITCNNGECGGTVDVNRDTKTAICLRCGTQGMEQMATLLIPFETYVLRALNTFMNVHMECIPSSAKSQLPLPPQPPLKGAKATIHTPINSPSAPGLGLDASDKPAESKELVATAVADDFKDFHDNEADDEEESELKLGEDGLPIEGDRTVHARPRRTIPLVIRQIADDLAVEAERQLETISSNADEMMDGDPTSSLTENHDEQ